MNDVLPAQAPAWQYLEKTMRELLSAYAYQEIRFPVLEQTQLFKRSIGEVTDIVEKEMYTFEDRNGDSLSMRPEGTACCVRAAEQHPTRETINKEDSYERREQQRDGRKRYDQSGCAGKHPGDAIYRGRSSRH